MIRQISEYFGVNMTALPHDDWDTVETIIKKVIKVRTIHSCGPCSLSLLMTYS